MSMSYGVACACMGPQRGEPLCPCAMRDLDQRAQASIILALQLRNMKRTLADAGYGEKVDD